jgi:hypothetical protein
MELRAFLLVTLLLIRWPKRKRIKLVDIGTDRMEYQKLNVCFEILYVSLSCIQASSHQGPISLCRARHSCHLLCGGLKKL